MDKPNTPDMPGMPNQSNNIFQFWEKAAENYQKSFSDWQNMMPENLPDATKMFSPFQNMIQTMEDFFKGMSQVAVENLSEDYIKELHKRNFGATENWEEKTIEILHKMTTSHFIESYQKMLQDTTQIMQESQAQDPQEVVNFWQTLFTEYLRDMEAIPENAKRVDIEHLMNIWKKMATQPWDEETQLYSQRFWESLKVKLKYGVEYYADPESTKVAFTPRELVWKKGKTKLYHYHRAAGQNAHSLPVLIVYSLINRPYILDLLPRISLIEYLTNQGMDVYLIEWGEPKYEDREITLDAIIDPGISSIVDFICTRQKVSQVSLLGHCIGGVLALLYAASYPEKVNRLITLTTPITSTEGGIAGVWANIMPIDKIIDTFGNMPAKLIRYSFISLKPYFEVIRLKKFYETLDKTPEKSMQRFYAVDKWVNDNVDVPGEAFRKYITEVYQKDGLRNASITINGQTVDLKSITCPLLNIVANDDWIVTAASASILNDLVGSKEKTLRQIPGHHLSILLDPKSRHEVWPEILDFYQAGKKEDTKKDKEDKKEEEKENKEVSVNKNTFANVYAMLENTVEEYGDQVAYYQEKEKSEGEWEEITWLDFKKESDLFAMSLLQEGLEKGETVCVLAGNCLLWPLADMGTITAGGISVGLYPTSAPDQCAYILNHSSSKFVVVDSDEQLQKILAIIKDVPSLQKIIVGPKVEKFSPSEKIVRWDDFLLGGNEFEEEKGWAKLQEVAHSSQYDETAIIVYTSGTTGQPKGACLSHRYVLASSESLDHIFSEIKKDVLHRIDPEAEEPFNFLSFLPFCHVAERISGMYARMYSGYPAYFVEDPRKLNQYLTEVSPHIFGGLPRFYEKIYAKIMDEVEKGEIYSKDRFQEAISIAKEVESYHKKEEELPSELKEKFAQAEKDVYSKVRANFGQRILACTSGAAPVPIEVLDMFRYAGNLSILEAYGLTEFVCCAFNTPTAQKANSVGKAMPGCEIQIAPSDGEILLRGPQMFSGYYQDEKATQETIQKDGWLQTGDIGKLDEEGFLSITGRKKEFIKTSTGKKIAPLYIENLCKRNHLISNVMVYGDNKKYLTALITLNLLELKSYADHNNIAYKKASELPQSPEIKKIIEQSISEMNEKVSRTEQIKRFSILEKDFSLEENEITPTGKVKRKVVSENYQDVIEGMYSE